MVPGTVAADAPVRGPHGDWLLGYLGGGFVLLAFGNVVPAAAARALENDPVGCRVVTVGGAAGDGRIVLHDHEGLLAQRYDGREGTCYLIRPDQHVCARWRGFDLAAVRAAIRRATAQ